MRYMMPILKHYLKNMKIIIILFSFSLISSSQADEKLNKLKVALPVDRFGFKFEEPKYPKGTNTALLDELTWFFGGIGDFKKEKTQETWNELLVRMKKANLPSLAEKKDLKVTDKVIANISDRPILIVFGHQHPVNTALHIGKYRTHWLPAEGIMKNESGYSGMDLFWLYPHDIVLGKSFTPPEFLQRN